MIFEKPLACQTSQLVAGFALRLQCPGLQLRNLIQVTIIMGYAVNMPGFFSNVGLSSLTAFSLSSFTAFRLSSFTALRLSSLTAAQCLDACRLWFARGLSLAAELEEEPS